MGRHHFSPIIRRRPRFPLQCTGTLASVATCTLASSYIQKMRPVLFPTTGSRNADLFLGLQMTHSTEFKKQSRSTRLTRSTKMPLFSGPMTLCSKQVDHFGDHFYTCKKFPKTTIHNTTSTFTPPQRPNQCQAGNKALRKTVLHRGGGAQLAGLS